MSASQQHLRNRRSSRPRRRPSQNELAASLRIQQLRSLQSQLSVMIIDAKDAHATPTVLDDEESLGSSINSSRDLSGKGALPSFDSSPYSGLGRGSRVSDAASSSALSSECTSLLLANTGGDGLYDIESGLLPETYKPGSSMALYTPQRKSPLISSSTFNCSDNTLLIANRANSLESEMSMDETKSNISGVSAEESTKSLSSAEESRNTDLTNSIISDSIRSAASSNGLRSNNKMTMDISSLDGSESSRKSRWARSRDGARSISRSLGHRSRSGSRGRRSRYSSIFKGKYKSSDSVRPSKKSLRMLPNYDFLGKDEDEDKEESSLRPGAKWWHGVFLFSLVSMLACIITLWAPHPIGARMPTEMIAATPWSSGCKNGLQSCICPRETICADDLLSMIFLTIARSTAWFDYPLYMLLFLSKANNLNEFLQKTALRCWINFSDYHRVHKLFGMIVGLEGSYP